MTELALFLVGIVVGIMNAVAGGGMLLGFPALLAAGLPPISATMTSNVVIIPGQLSSAWAYRHFLQKLHRRYLILLIPCIAGGAVGALILRNTSSARFQEIVPALIFFAVALFAVQPLLHFHLRRHIAAGSRSLLPLILISLAILPVAAYGGYFGPGFGFIMLAFLSFAKLHDAHQMNGLKNLAGASIAGMALLCLFTTGQINWALGLAMAAGNTLGGALGAHASQRLSSHAVRIVVIAIGLCAATYLAIRTYSLWPTEIKPAILHTVFSVFRP